MEILNDLQFNSIVEYLKNKGVWFAVNSNYSTMLKSIVGIEITKTGKFYRANGKIISTNHVQYFFDGNIPKVKLKN